MLGLDINWRSIWSGFFDRSFHKGQIIASYMTTRLPGQGLLNHQDSFLKPTDPHLLPTGDFVGILPRCRGCSQRILQPKPTGRCKSVCTPRSRANVTKRSLPWKEKKNKGCNFESRRESVHFLSVLFLRIVKWQFVDLFNLCDGHDLTQGQF